MIDISLEIKVMQKTYQNFMMVKYTYKKKCGAEIIFLITIVIFANKQEYQRTKNKNQRIKRLLGY